MIEDACTLFTRPRRRSFPVALWGTLFFEGGKSNVPNHESTPAKDVIISMLQDLQATLWPWCFVAPGVSLHVLKSRHAPSFWTRRILKFLSLWDTGLTNKFCIPQRARCKSFIYLSPNRGRALVCERHPSTPGVRSLKSTSQH